MTLPQSNATENNPNKRARFSEPVTTAEDGEPKYSATSTLQKHLDTVFESLQSKTIANYARQQCQAYVKLKNLERQQRQKLKRTSVAGYVPISARFTFELKSNDAVGASTEFKALDEECKAAIKTCQETLQAKVVKTIDLEIKQTDMEIRRLYNHTVLKLAQLFLYENDPQLDLTHHPRTLALWSVNDGEKILPEGNVTRNIFFQDFKTFHNCQQPLFDPTSANATQKLEIKDLISKMALYCHYIFPNAWSKMMQFYESRDNEKALHKLLTEAVLDDATKDTDIDMSNEETLDAPQIKKLIKEGIEKGTKDLKAEIATLQQKLRSAQQQVKKQQTDKGKGSNKPGAARRRSASPKKSRGNAKAGGSSKGTNDGKNGSKKNDSKKKSNTKNNNSNRKSRRSQPKSKQKS